MANKKTLNNLNPKDILKRNGGKKPIPRTAQQSLGYINAFENGVMQVEPGAFTITGEFDDISFSSASEEDQESIYSTYMKFLNKMNPKEDIFFHIVNKNSDKKEKLEKIAPLMKGDKYDELRKEYAGVLRDKLANARNNIETKKYITIRTENTDTDTAIHRLDNMSSEINADFKKITKSPIKWNNLAKRMEMLDSIMNGKEKNLWFEHDAKGNVSVDFTKMIKQGLTTKDIIAPEALKYSPNKFQIGGRFGQAMYMEQMANWMSTAFLADLSAVNFESCITIHIEAIPQNDALKIIHDQSVNITAEVIKKQQSALREGYSPDFLPAELQRAKDAIDSLQEDLMNRDQRIFYTTIVMTHFADTEEELEENSRTLRQIAAKYMSKLSVMYFRQEKGFLASMPYGIDNLNNKRPLTTESLGVFMPFNEISQFDENGIYYGINSINKSVIVYDRLLSQNYNGLILGAPGSGKSFSAKREMTAVLLNKNADVFVIDPDGEYTPIANAFNGSVIKIAPGNGTYINPFDLDIDTSGDDSLNPLAMKVDFICGLIETMLGAGAKLTQTEISIITRCINRIYKPYIEHLHDIGKTIDIAQCPTMENLYEELMAQTNAPEAQSLAVIIEGFTSGPFDLFAHRTNVDLNNRFIVYDIHNIGGNLMEIGLKICTNDVWNRMVRNKREGKWTWFYVDEFHLLLSNQSTSEFVKTIWKRARKFWGVPTGITQNVEDLLNSAAARTIINTTSFMYLLNQSTMDRAMLKELLKLSDSDVEEITEASQGCGLLYTGQRAIPFTDEFPNNTKLYHIMSTKAGEDNEF